MSGDDGHATRQFELLLTQLQETVARLEGDDLTLDDAVLAYERCVDLANQCSRMLDAAELRISSVKIENSTLREQAEVYTFSSTARRLLLGDDDDLADLLDDDES